MGAEPGRRGGGSAGWSLPCWEGPAAAASSHLLGRLRRARPGPRGGLLLLLHGGHRPRPAAALTSSRALQTRGPSLGRNRMSQAPEALRIGGRQSGGDGVGGGQRWGGEEERQQASSPLQDPSFGHRRPSNSPLPPPPTSTPPPQSADGLGEPTPPSAKLVERPAAGERHLPALERGLAVPEEPGSPPPQSAPPASPRGRPAPSSARQVEQPGAARQHLWSNCKAAESTAPGASAPHARRRLPGSAGPLTPARPPRAPAKTRRSGVRAGKALGGCCAVTGHAPALREASGQRGPGRPEPHPGHQHLSGPQRLSWTDYDRSSDLSR